MERRNFLKAVGGGIVGAGFSGYGELFAKPTNAVRRVLVMSDIHIGYEADGFDGAIWLNRALEDLESQVEPIDYALTLGDITHDGDSRSLQKYLAARESSSIPKWLELAGNHEHHNRGIDNYVKHVRDVSPYSFIDGNIAWFFISDESRSCPGFVSDTTFEWLKKNLTAHRDKILILCTHQLMPYTIHGSWIDQFCLLPKEKISNILENFPIRLSLCGHEHHGPYSDASIAKKGTTTFMNAASVNHAYGTQCSRSLILEFRNNSKEIVIYHRNHDAKSSQIVGNGKIKLPQSIRIS